LSAIFIRAIQLDCVDDNAVDGDDVKLWSAGRFIIGLVPKPK
jgi:hypothetical protein